MSSLNLSHSALFVAQKRDIIYVCRTIECRTNCTGNGVPSQRHQWQSVVGEACQVFVVVWFASSLNWERNKVQEEHSGVKRKSRSVISLLSSNFSRVLHLSDRTVFAEQLLRTATVLGGGSSNFASDSIPASESRHISTSLKQPIVHKGYISAKIIDTDSPSQRGEYSRCQIEAKQFAGQLCFRMSNLVCERTIYLNVKPQHIEFHTNYLI